MKGALQVVRPPPGEHSIDDLIGTMQQISKQLKSASQNARDTAEKILTYFQAKTMKSEPLRFQCIRPTRTYVIIYF